MLNIDNLNQSVTLPTGFDTVLIESIEDFLLLKDIKDFFLLKILRISSH